MTRNWKCIEVRPLVYYPTLDKEYPKNLTPVFYLLRRIRLRSLQGKHLFDKNKKVQNCAECYKILFAAKYIISVSRK